MTRLRGGTRALRSAPHSRLPAAHPAGSPSLSGVRGESRPGRTRKEELHNSILSEQLDSCQPVKPQIKR